MNRFQFVADHQAAYGGEAVVPGAEIAPVQLLLVAVGRPGLGRRRLDAQLAEQTQTHAAHDGTYGSRASPPSSGPAQVNHSASSGSCALHGIAGLRLRRKARTTVPAPDPVLDLLRRDFTALTGRRYVGDITYPPIADGTSCTWRPCWTWAHGGWWAGRSPTTCAPAR